MWGQPPRLSPHELGIRIPCWARQVRDFHKRQQDSGVRFHIDSRQCSCWNSASDTAFAGNRSPGCTKSGQGPVDGVHSVENTSSYEVRFFVDGKNRKSTKGSFFDSFLKFFRLVRRPGLKRSHCSDRKIGMEGKRGSIAKRWSRRTEETSQRQDRVPRRRVGLSGWR